MRPELSRQGSGRVLLWGAVALLAAMGCGGGSSDPGGGIGVTITPAFAPALAMPGPQVTLVESSVRSGRITLDLVLSEIGEPVSGVAIKLSYPAEISRFIDCRDGDLFPPGRCIEEEPPGLGEVFLSLTIINPEPAVDASGSVLAAQLEFLVFELGDGSIEFEGQNLAGSDASAVLDVNGDPIFVNWYAGEISGS